MDNVVNITNTKENVLDFDLSIEGLTAKDIQAKFVIKTKDMDYLFPCTKQKGDKWSVTIPKMASLEKTAYDYCIMVIADGYYFEPLKGTINVVGSHQLYTTTPQNTTAKPVEKAADKEKKIVKKEEKKPVKEQTTKKARELSVADLARSLMEKQELGKKLPDTTPPADVDPTTDKKVRDILESLGSTHTERKELFKPRKPVPVVEKVETPIPVLLTESVLELAPVEEEPVNEADQKVQKVFEELGIKSTRKKRAKFSLKD